MAIAVSGSRVMKELRVGSRRSMRSKWACTTSTGDTSRRCIKRPKSPAVKKHSSVGSISNSFYTEIDFHVPLVS